MNFLLFNVIIHFIWIFFLMQTIIYASEDQCALSEIWPRLLAQIGYILMNLTTGWAMKFTIIGILLITIVMSIIMITTYFMLFCSFWLRQSKLFWKLIMTYLWIKIKMMYYYK